MPEQIRKKKTFEAVKPLPAYVPTPFEPADATAIQALARGDCPPNLQQRALNYIIYRLCGTYEPQYRQGGDEADRETTFSLGKQFVGQQLVGLLKVKVITGGEQP